MARAALDQDAVALEQANEADVVVIHDELAAEEGRTHILEQNERETSAPESPLHPDASVPAESKKMEDAMTRHNPNNILGDIDAKIVEEDEESSGSDTGIDDEGNNGEDLTASTKRSPALSFSAAAAAAATSTPRGSKNRVKKKRPTIITDSRTLRRIVSVHGTDMEPSEKKLQRRSTIIEEIIVTEEKYVADLETLLTLFVRPLLKEINNDTPDSDARTSAALIMQNDDIAHLLSCVSVILKSNTEFLKALKTTLSMSNTVTGQSVYVADTMWNHVPALSGYTQYLSVFQVASTALHEAKESNMAFAEFLRKKEARGRCRTDFFSMLILPVQRIPRYELFVRELLGHTSATHEDHTPLTKCAEAIGKMGARINAACDDIEKNHWARHVASKLNSATQAGGLRMKVRIDDDLIFESEVRLVWMCDIGGGGGDGSRQSAKEEEEPPDSQERKQRSSVVTEGKSGGHRETHRMVLYAHALCLVRVMEDHTWKIVSVCQVDERLTATLTIANFLMVKWGGVNRYEVDGNDLGEIAEHVEDALTAHLNRHSSRNRSRSRSIVVNAHPFWSPKKRGSQTLNATWEGSSGMKALTKKKSSCGDNMVHNLAQLKMSALLHSKASMAKMELGAGVRGGKKVGTDE
jgi:hypothetical protein